MRFLVNAVDARQTLVALDLHAESEAGAVEAARSRGLTVISARPQTAAPARPWGRSSAFPTALFSVELVSLLEAGLNLVEALQTLADKEAHGERQVVVTGLLDALRRGESFSQAVGRYTRHFPPLYVATVRAAERTGDVKEALGRYIAYQEEVDRVRKKVVAASIYPAILLTVGTLVLAFLLFYVVPRFARVYPMTGMLLRAGIPAVPALEMVRDVLVAHLRPHLSRAKQCIEQGQPMSAAFGSTGLATPVAGRMMAVGERSGRMGEMLQRIARFHDDETARSVEWFTRAFEPVLMAVLGIAIGLVVVLMYMPIFELAGSIR
jgi:general secretion pathway protein F